MSSEQLFMTTTMMTTILRSTLTQTLHRQLLCNPPSACGISYSLYALQFLIHTTFSGVTSKFRPRPSRAKVI